MVVVQVMDVVTVGVSVLLVPHGILVHGSVGLGGGVVGRRDAVTGLAAVVALPVVHSAVWIIICSHKHSRFYIYLSAGIYFRLQTAPTNSSNEVRQLVCSLRGKTQGRKWPAEYLSQHTAPVSACCLKPK